MPRPTSRRAALAAVCTTLVAGACAPAAQRPSRAPIDVVELTAQQIQADYAAHKYTAVQLTRAYLDRIARYEPRYNAFISMNPDALSTARALDKEMARSGPRGPLFGVPVVIKDNMDFGGLVTTAGFKGFSSATGGLDNIPDSDATAVARLKAAGAIILGKTNLPDFAGNGTRTWSTVAGATLNPYNVDKVPGGSSGGTATAVNASFAVLGLGTETGGSIENPSSVQALVGVKATLGLVPTDGVVPIDVTYRDVVGPLAKTVHDAAVTLDVLAGPSNSDLTSYAGEGHIPEGGYAAHLDTTSLRGKRFGLVGPGWRERWLPLDPATAAIYERAVAALKAQGAEVVDDPFQGSGFVELYAKEPRVPSVGSHDMLQYLLHKGPGATFHSIQEWEDMTGDTFPGRQQREPAHPPQRHRAG